MMDFFPGMRRETPDFELCRYGTISEISPQGVKLRFDGETAAGSMHFTHISAYSPEVGDRVLLIRCKSDYIVLGAIVR